MLNSGLADNNTTSFLTNKNRLFVGGLILLLTLLPLKLVSQNLTKKEIQTYRLENSDELIFDGRVTEDFWDRVPAATDFRQQEPNEGDPATEKTEVRIAYDDEYLYMGVILYDSDPSGIKAS